MVHKVIKIAAKRITTTLDSEPIDLGVAQDSIAPKHNPSEFSHIYQCPVVKLLPTDAVKRVNSGGGTQSSIQQALKRLRK